MPRCVCPRGCSWPDYVGAAIAQGVLKVAEGLIGSYTNIKGQARQLSGKSVVAEGGEQDWDLGLTLRVAEFSSAKLERLRLLGNR